MKNTRGVVIGTAAIVCYRNLLRGAIHCSSSSWPPKTRSRRALLKFSWPKNFVLFDNIQQAFAARDYLMVIAFINSVILTVVSVAALVILSAMVAYVWQRRGGRPGQSSTSSSWPA